MPAACAPTPAGSGVALAGPSHLRCCASCRYYLSHAQHEGDRFNHGWPMNGKWHDPEVELPPLADSLHVELERRPWPRGKTSTTAGCDTALGLTETETQPAFAEKPLERAQ